MSNLYIGTKRPKGIYLGASKVKAVYLGTEKVWSSQAERTANYVSIGTPNIDSDFILTPSQGNFVKSPSVFSPNGQSWEVTTKINVNAVSGYVDVIGSIDSSNASTRGFIVESSVGTPKWNLWLSSNGTGWDISSGSVRYETALTTDVWISVKFDGSAYYIGVSYDGENYSYAWLNSTVAIKDGYYIGVGLKRNGVLNGTIDLKETKVYINGSLWWSAVTES